MWGQTGPDLRLEAAEPGSPDPPAIIGDTLEAEQATFTARVLNLDAARAARPGTYELMVLRDGAALVTVPIPPTGDRFEFEFPSLGHARYGLEVIRPGAGAASIEAYSSPIWLVPPTDGPGPPPPPPAEDCSDELRGTDGADQFFGTPESDAFRGGRGGDRIQGRPGNDCLRGGRGADLIRGGKGADVLRGGRGRDRIAAADGEADEVRCGRGRRDWARADALDSIRGCETVVTGRPARGGPG